MTWVNEYLRHTYGETRALEIIEDIDHRQVNKVTLECLITYEITFQYSISAVPPFPGLRRFPDGRDFTQWTGDDSKALMKVRSICPTCRISELISSMSRFTLQLSQDMFLLKWSSVYPHSWRHAT